MAAEWICRAVRDGALEGDHAPAVSIKDTMASPLGFHVFTHFLSQQSTNISAAKSQSRGLVLVALSRSPSFYLDLLSNKGLDTASLSNKLLLGSSRLEGPPSVLIISGNLKDVDALFSSVISLGTGFVGQGKDRFCVAIDSVNEMLRYASLSSVSGLISSLRCCGQISSIFWLCHADLCEERVTSALEYMSSMVASIEPLIQFANGQRSINFTSISSEGELINQGLVPKVQFSLQLSEKELKDRANVVLPFEHQGNGKPVQIYDGRKSLTDSKCEKMKCQILMRTLMTIWTFRVPIRNVDLGTSWFCNYRKAQDRQVTSYFDLAFHNL
ncbi:hypothetical protein ACLB2K_040370 [Fragaria x ananassa]